jgi:hypothetical protein
MGGTQYDGHHVLETEILKLWHVYLYSQSAAPAQEF